MKNYGDLGGFYPVILLDLHNITIDYESLTEDKRLQMPNVNAMNL